MGKSDSSSSHVWFVTGCSSGLGQALARAALSDGHRVIATARRSETLNDLEEQFPETCRVFSLDVTDHAQVAEVVKKGAGCFDRLDVVVNNAGYGLVGAFEELSDEEIQRSFETNLFGALAVTRAALPILREQGSGHLVNMSAAAVISNYAGFSIYGATKWALEGVSESLAQELKPLGIKVTLVEPGPFRTDFISRSMERAENRLSDYDRSSGRFLSFLESMDGKQSGDPVRASRAIIAAVESDRPPLRLVLGKYAIDKARQKLASTEKELSQWEEVGLSTDHV